MISTARPRIVRFDSPRKSILSRPILARLSALYWVIRLASLREVAWRGVYSVSGSRAITTPAAWVEAWRGEAPTPRAAPLNAPAQASPSTQPPRGGVGPVAPP